MKAKPKSKSPVPVFQESCSFLDNIGEAAERFQRKHPDLVVSRSLVGVSQSDVGQSIILEAWEPMDFLVVAYPDLTLAQKIHQWERALDFINVNKWNNRFKRWEGGLATLEKSAGHKAIILDTYNAFRADNPDEKKTWIQDRVCEKLKNRRPNIGFSLRSIKTVTKALK